MQHIICTQDRPIVDGLVNNPQIQRYRRMSGELKNQKFSLPNESSENPNCYIHFSDGKNITVSLKEGMIVNDLLKDVASYHGVDNQVGTPPSNFQLGASELV